MTVPTPTFMTKTELCRIINDTKTGIFFLDGKSGIGKTHILKTLRNNSPKSVVLLSYDTVKDKLIDSIKNNIPIDFPSADIICIEDVDFLHGKEQTQVEFAHIAKRLSENALVIFTGISLLNRVPILMEHTQHFTYYTL